MSFHQRIDKPLFNLTKPLKYAIIGQLQQYFEGL